MVNVFQRLTRRAPSSSSTNQEGSTSTTSTSTTTGQFGTGTRPRSGSLPARASSHGRIRRSQSVSSNKRLRRAPAEEPSPRHLILVSDTPEPDERILHRFQAEGFDVQYLSFSCSGDPDRDRKHLENTVHLREDELEAGERYAIVGMLLPSTVKKKKKNCKIASKLLNANIPCLL